MEVTSLIRNLDLRSVPPAYVAPHLLLPLCSIASLYIPPFQHRGLLSVALLSYLAYLVILSPWPYETQARFGFRQSWFALLPTISYHLFHAPEEDFWRRDRGKAEALHKMKSWGVQKLLWAAALWINPRGVGWSHQTKRLPDAEYLHGLVGGEKVVGRKEERKRHDWQKFLVLHLIDLFWILLLIDASLWILRRLVPKDIQEVGTEGLTQWDWWRIQTAIMVVTYAAWQFQWLYVSILGVLGGFSEPRDWPPFFSPLRSCTTVAYYWGSYWQQTLHNAVMDFGYFFVRILHIPRRTPLALFVYLITSFALSGFFHAVTWANLADYPPNEYVIEGTMKFFLAQVVGVMLEDVVIRTYQGLRGDKEPNVWKTVLGYLWVDIWLLATGRPFAQVIIRTEMPFWKAPLPLIEWVLGEKY